MEAKDLRNIWKSGVDKNITSYSDKQLSEMIVKSARKSIRRIYPSFLFTLIIAVVVGLLIFNITTKNTSAAMRMLDLTVLLFLSVCLTMWVLSFLTMKKYKADMSIRNWLEYRIGEVEKSLSFNTRYYLLLCATALLAALGYYYLFIWLSGVFVNLWVIAAVTIGILISIPLAQKKVIKNYQKTLRELKELHKQLEE